MILQLNDSMLRDHLPDFNFDQRLVDPLKLAEDLVETLKHHNALGVAANQFGLPYRVFAMATDPLFVCFNPTITYEEGSALLDEGCLSFPYLYLKIKRPAKIRAKFQDYNGDIVTRVFDGMTARIYLHELDHLNGITFQSKANQFHLNRGLNHQKKALRRTKQKA